MLSRTAEAFFWIGRYIERAEYDARSAMVHRHLLVDNPDPRLEIETWTRLLQTNGDLFLYRERYGDVTAKRALEFIALDTENPNSLITCVTAARENARTIQDQLSSEVWYHINGFYLELKSLSRHEFWSRTHEVLQRIRDGGYTLSGVITNTMLHDERMAFYQLGRDIERASRTVRLLRTPALIDAAAEPTDLDAFQQCVAALKTASAYEAFRKETRIGLDPLKIVEFLLLSERFPRSVRFCTRALGKVLPLVVPAGPSGQLSEPERVLGQFAADMEYVSLPDIYAEGLSGYLDNLMTRLDAFADTIARTYFRYAEAPGTPTSTLPQRRKAFPAQNTPTTAVQATIRVVQEFTYTYETPVTDVRTVLRLLPNQRYGRQRLLDVRWHLEPQGDERQQMDAFGNQVWQVDHARIDGRLYGRIEMLLENVAVHHAEGALLLGGVPLLDEDGVAGPAEYMMLTPLTELSEGMLAIAKRLQGEHRQSTLLAEAIMREVFGLMHYEGGVTGVGTSASAAFAQGRGVCQDYTHIMLAICRAAGLPARYVSGYLPSEGLMHAWVEVLVADPATGRDLWVAYDPTHNRRADESYVTVALGRDYADVAPMSGFYTGAARSWLEANVVTKVESRRPLSHTRGTAPLVMPLQELMPGQEAQQQ